MKTSNKLLLGFFMLVIVVITVGFVILKVELKNTSSNEFNNNKTVTDTVKIN